MELTDPEWVESVYERRLLARATSRSQDDAATDTANREAVVSACESIGEQVGAELARLRALIADSDVEASLEAAHDGGDQIHALVARVSSFDGAVALADAVSPAGYLRWEPWTGGAQECFRRLHSVLTVARTDERTYVLNIGWEGGSALDRVPQALRPNQADWSLVDLPPPLWFAYFAVRPVRLIGQRLGLISTGASHLGPFLATPESLLDPLFDFADVAVDDVVVDLGCGDGRLVIEAARRRGCRGRGIESDPELVLRARAAALEAGVADCVEIVEGDAETAELGDATVVFVFLPAEVASTLIPEVVTRLAPNSRVVAHEQNQLPTQVAPERSVVLVSSDAVTVAHRWG